MLTLVHDFLITRFLGKKTGCFIGSLSDDILVDHIFIYFSVEEIFALRRVSKLYYYLTHQPVIWKRFLQRLKIPLPPLPPTPRYSLEELASEAERLVVRALSLDDNWRSFHPKLYCIRRATTYHQVYDMVLLPGGKYLVASVDCGHRRYAIIVFLLDHNGSKCVALAKTPTKSKAYNLRAKYMTFNDSQGITIAYLCRDFKDSHHEQAGIDPSDYSPTAEIDTPFPLRYECVCLQVSLQILEPLFTGPKFSRDSPEFREYAVWHPPPFRELAKIRSSATLSSLSLIEHVGTLYVAFVRLPDKVVIKCLTSGLITTLKCALFEPFSDLEQTILRAHVFPKQQQVFVIRTVPASPPEAKPLYLLEIYNTPQPGSTAIAQAVDRYLIEDKRIVDFQISDGNSTDNDRSVHGTLPAARGPPVPVSIFCRTVEPHGLYHLVVWPTHFEIPATSGSGPSKFYFYSLRNTTFQSRHDCDHVIPHALPGAFRTLIYTVPEDDHTATPPLLDLRRYICPESQPFDYPMPPVEEEEEIPVMRKRKGIPANIYATLTIPKPLAMGLRKNGITSVAWDEGIGRVCIAASNDPTIHILDFAQVPKSSLD